MPPITATQARIDVMVNGQRNLDRLASTYLTAERNAQRAQRAVQGWGVANTAFARGVTGVLGSINNLSSRLAQHTQQVNQANRATGSWGGSILKLTQSMVLFSVLLPLVKLPETAIRSFQNFVDVGVEWEHNLRSVNSLLNLQGNEYTQYNNALKATTVQYGLMNDEIGGATKQIASTLGVLQRNTVGMTTAQRAQQDMNDTMALTDKIARLSRSSFEDMNSVQEAAFTMLAAGKLDITQADAAFDSLFRTVQVGRSTFDQFNKSAGQFIPLAEDWIQVGATAEDRFTRLTGVLNAFEAASMTLGSAKAATGLGQIFQALTRGSGAQQQIVMLTQNMRRIQGLGEQFDITPQGLYSTNNTQDMFARIRNVMGPQGLLVNQYVNQLRNMGKLQDEAAARASRSHFLLTQYLGNVRAARAFEAIDPNTLAEAAAAHQAAPGEAGGFAQYQQDPQAAAQRASRAYDMVKTTVFDAMQRDFIGLNLGVSNMFDNIRKEIEGGAGGTSVFSRIAYIGGRVLDSFTQWYNGPGRKQISTFGHDLGAFIADAITAFFSGKDGQNAIADAGLQFSKAFAGAVAERLPALLGAALTSAVGQSVVSYLLLRQAGAGRATAAVGAGAAVTGMQSGGIAGQALGLGILGFGALTAGKILWNRPMRYAGTGAGRVPIAGTSPAEMFSNLRGGAVTRAARASYSGADYATGAELRAQGINRGVGGFLANDTLYNVTGPRPVRAFPRGDPAEADIVQARRLAVRAGSPGGRRLQIGGGVATAAVLGGLGVMNAMQAPPGERSIAALSAIGGTAGMLLGGLLGAIPAVATAGLATPVAIAGSVGGGFLGSKAGEWAGEKLSPWLEPLLGGGAAAAATNAATDAAQQQTVADAVAEGLDSSQVGAAMIELNRKTIMGTGMGGGLAVGTRTPGVMGSGNGGSFVNQYDPNSTLTPAQANAACGPAAASFFVSAYGRQPTLAEAYALQSQLQGGDIAGLGGSNINTLGTAINQMAGSNVATVGNGIDWGILAQNAQAGIPGIANIGPNGQFPGHYFQIGGYNPATGQYNVGASGTAVHGGSTMMTAAQMMAYGPAAGAIYGAAGAGGGGNYAQMAMAAAKAAGIDPTIYMRQIQQESGFDPKATSGAGAMGIAQFMKGTYGAGVDWDPYNPSVALTKGAQYMALLSKKYGGMRNALWAYNAGEGNYAAGVMPAETKSYLNTILGAQAGSGTGGGPMGGGVVINGPLIGTVMLGAGSTEDQANELATILADILDESHLTAGSSVGQTRLLTP